jgi:hypothetical protein
MLLPPRLRYIPSNPSPTHQGRGLLQSASLDGMGVRGGCFIGAILQSMKHFLIKPVIDIKLNPQYKKIFRQ